MFSIWGNTGCDDKTEAWYCWKSIGEHPDTLGEFFSGPNGLMVGTHAYYTCASSLLTPCVSPEMFGARGDGVTDVSVVLGSVVEALCDVPQGELCLVEGSTYRIGSDLSIPAGVTLSGLGTLRIDDGVHLRISAACNVDIPTRGLLFDIPGSGVVTFSDYYVIPLGWFWAVPDTLEDASHALQKACDSLVAGGVIQVPSGRYTIGADVEIPEGVTLKCLGGVIMPDDGVTVIVSGHVACGDELFFDESFCVTGGGVMVTNDTINRAWWGQVD